MWLGKAIIFQKYERYGFYQLEWHRVTAGTNHLCAFFSTFPKKCFLGCFSWMGHIDKVHRAKLQYCNGCELLGYSLYLVAIFFFLFVLFLYCWCCWPNVEGLSISSIEGCHVDCFVFDMVKYRLLIWCTYYCHLNRGRGTYSSIILNSMNRFDPQVF